MPTELQMLSRVRGRLRNPMANHPSDGDVLREICSHKRNLSRHRQNTGNPWDYRSLIITVDSNEAEYLLPDNNFGKPFAVLTRDDSNPSHIQSPVSFFEPQNLTFDWGLPNDAGNSGLDGSNHSALRVAIYRRNSNAYARFQPIPQLSCDYEIFYTPRSQFGESLATVPEDESDCDLIEVRAARSLLAFTEWGEDKTVNESRRKELALTLTADEQMYARQFEADVLVTHGARITTRWTPPE